MSNTNSTIQFLKANPSSNFIRLTNLDTDKDIGPKQNIFLSDIPNEDLIAYLKFLLGDLTHNIDVWVEHRTQKGATNVKVGTAYRLPVVAPKTEPTPQPVNHPAPVIQPVAATPVSYDPMFGNAGHGLNGGQLMGMMLKAERLEDVKRDYAELKEEFKDLKQENRNFDNENRDLKTKLSTSEAQKDLAVMLAKNETRSFLDSEAFGKLMERAPEVIGMLAGIKGGGAAETMATGLAAANVSEVKQSFMQIIANNCTDEQVNYLGSIVYYMGNQDFINNLNALITTHAGQH